MFHKTLSVLWILVELFALVRAGIATYTLVYAVTGNQLYTIFTLLVIEGVFFCALFLMRVEVVAPIAALLALVFSGVAQYYELRMLAGALTDGEREILNYVIAFSPTVVLALAYIRNLVGSGDTVRQVVDAVRGVVSVPPTVTAGPPASASTATPGAPRGSKRGG